MSKPWFWLSFVDADPPFNDGRNRSLGITIVQGENAMDAVQTAWDLGCNPGGEVQILELPAEQHEQFAKYRNRLVKPEELREDGILSERERRRRH